MKSRYTVRILRPGKRWIILFLLLLNSVFVGVSELSAQTVSAPAKTAELRLTGLRDRVTVRRDERYIPHIQALNEADLFFAQGYVTASDRLWQMDLLRRTARGELSEIFGRATFEEDKNRRVYGFAKLSEDMLAHCSPSFRAALDAYARGVNVFIESLDDKTLPIEFRILQYRPRAWTSSDSLVIGKIFAETLSMTWPIDSLRSNFANVPKEQREMIFPETSPLDVVVVGRDPTNSSVPPLEAPKQRGEDDLLMQAANVLSLMQRSLERIGLYAEDRAASNNWVVSGRLTSSGKPLLANDLHLAPSVPSIWYLSSLSAPDINVAGASVPGAPGIIVGHNKWIAWGITNLGADVQDLYVEKFETDNGSRYLTPDGWRDAVVRREEINVRQDPSEGTFESVPVDVKVTRHGPIIFGGDSKYYALRWTALEPDAIEFEAFFRLNKARSWADFRRALSYFAGPPQNFVYADVDGHIGYYGAGRIPIRKGCDPTVPCDGSLHKNGWIGFVPFKDLPHLLDPPSGVIVTANQRIAGKTYPYYLTREWQEPYRARRIYELLKNKPKATVDDFRSIQLDAYSYPDAIFAAEIVKLARGLAPTAPEWRAMLDTFATWDGSSSAESQALPLLVRMRRSFQQEILNAALGSDQGKRYRWANEETFVDLIITTRPQAWLPKEFTSYEALLLACYKEAREQLQKQLGADERQWTWGKTGQIRFRHPLAAGLSPGQFGVPPFPRNTGGTSATVNAGAFVSMRFIADVGSWNNTRLGITLGESGDPNSPYWKDQYEDWRAGSTGLFPFDNTAIAQAAQHTLLLTPR